MSNHVNSLLFTPFAGLLNLAKRAGLPESVVAPALRGAGVPDAIDCSKLIEEMTREAVKPLRAHLTTTQLVQRRKQKTAAARLSVRQRQERQKLQKRRVKR